MKDNEIINERINTVNALDVYVGKYFSVDWVKRNVLKQTDEDIDELDKQMKKENDANTEMDAALADPDMGNNNIDGTKGPPNGGTSNGPPSTG